MPIRVLVVDDSAFMRRVVGEAIASQPDMELVGCAHTGLDALLKVEELQPDVVTLDVEMPEMDGLTALRHMMARYPRPVVMLSSQTQQGATTTIRALSIGAVDFVAKPSGSISLHFRQVREELIHKVRVAAAARIRPALPTSARPRAQVAPLEDARPSGTFQRLVVIGSSTGGPRALGTLVPGLARDGHTAYLIVQHMPDGFTHSLAERLNASSEIRVQEAQSGDRLSADLALVAPGDHHLRLSSAGMVTLDQGPRLHGVRPSIDVTLESVAQYFGSRAVVAVLTGMGHDGAAGAVSVHEQGGYVIAEDESTCVVFGMPRAVVERGVADRVVPLERVGAAIASAAINSRIKLAS
jgi:two-component system chemotaxis response regulator CheB